MPPVTGNPNAEVAVYAGAASVVIAWLLGHFGIDIPAEVGAALTTGLTGLVLLAGRRKKPGP